MARESASLSQESGVSEIASFFNKKSVFITGAAGFLGSVLLEVLLRCCPGIHNIYILLRENKVGPVKQRREKIFEKHIFRQLREENPDVFGKVKVVEGDITSTNLGLSESDLDEVLQNVSIVFHCAAKLHFTKPLRHMLIQNVLGTQNVIDLCTRIKSIEVLVYSSTAICHCNQGDARIQESIYKTKVPASRFLKELRSYAGDDVLTSLQSQCTPTWPNNYVFTKALAEDLLEEYSSVIPIAIVRPSMIGPTWKGSLPGYVEEGSILVDMCAAVGKGYIRTVLMDGSQKCNVIPADVVVNALICAANKVNESKKKPIFIVNCIMSELNPITWNEYCSLISDVCGTYPLPNSFRTPSFVMESNPISYWVRSLLHHYLPAICIDLFLILKRKKPMVTKLYMAYEKNRKVSYFGADYTWNMSCENFKELINDRSPIDSQLFPMDVREFSIREFAYALPNGAPLWNWAIDKREKRERIDLMKKRTFFSTSLSYTAVALFILLAMTIMKMIVTII